MARPIGGFPSLASPKSGATRGSYYTDRGAEIGQGHRPFMLHAVRIRRGTSYVMEGERDGIKKMSEGARTEVKRLAKLLPSSTRRLLARST